MTTILDPSFENHDFSNWSVSADGSGSIGFGKTYVTNGTWGAVATVGDPGGAYTATYVGLYQTITFGSTFNLLVDFKHTETNAGLYFRVRIDSTTLYSLAADSAAHPNVSINISGFYGSHTLYLETYYPAGTLHPTHTCYWDNLRIQNEQNFLNDSYVDINKTDDSGAGTSFGVAKKTMKAGWDILNISGTMHVATGDYSAQTTITYDKSWSLSPEDPNSVGNKTVSIPKST
jgi:hypothetical protein